ncbi:aminoglycoside N3'-acetyltransferase [Chthonomonas calidirosea]|uniref:Aminoglycoside N(3)-acetyltransferase n=1 Tax=Chthonomonas calidirosea (strain DSM 23976 / ICMP 18418 / T49) TaxID=1303518 RepID=S0ESR0_CHTCT|nr:AAC(3) family N-acetyltransferase [Chthonomonas calidirosea]CCW34376.1 Aminoglycoside N3'-acetyltransferase [Chthonomonas calidirosea T49]CEK13758.1 aminoglycoside N3'-acetyltransferase [Chthonomonas calidirosea]CEK13760.1 aminoglycoside N3'-acetyltransferase [Chthonomonas calidirosea]CEK14951.1 aminoglycoside N3'-acetyltransferase [Chthonomonas calidirosea]
MFSVQHLVTDLQNLGLRSGVTLLVHSTWPSSAAPLPQTLLDALLTVLGPTGTLMVPTFTYTTVDSPSPTTTPTENGTQYLPGSVFRIRSTPADSRIVGPLPELVRTRPKARRSRHPVFSFAAIGPNAPLLTHTAPFHFPFGSNSPLAHLHRLNGELLLLNTDQRSNLLLHLAEVWAEVPYLLSTLRVKVGQERWRTMRGKPGCTEGFVKIEPLLRQARLIRYGTIGSMPAQRMNVQAVVSMAVALLKGAPDALLCDSPNCTFCQFARRITQKPQPLPSAPHFELL